MPWGTIYKNCKGFSLVEMSVVLTSVAAVVMAVVGGVSMMNKSRLGNVTANINKFTNAIVQFEKKHGALPGDIADVSAISGASGSEGNGNGTIDTAAEALNVWYHLSTDEFLDGTYDGTSTFVPGTGVPAAGIEGSGYNIKVASTVTAKSLPDQALVIELSGFNGTDDNALPIITAEDAKALDEKADDGDPESGNIIAEGSGTDCVTGGNYNVSNTVASCRLLFVVRTGKSNPPAIGGSCTEIGQTRQISNVSMVCPEGYLGKIIETCRIDETNQGSWQITDWNCQEVKCSGGSYGDVRKLACINGMVGTEGVVERCAENGIWQRVSSDCQIKESTPCPTNGKVRAKAQACDWGQNGYMLQTCTNNRWGPAAPSTCSLTLAGSECASASLSYGEARNTSVDCDVDGADYIGDVNEVCTMAGTLERTSIGSSCVPDYSGTCTAGVTADKPIGCPPGKTGEHILTCANATTDYWTTLRDTCEPITCPGGMNIGTSRVKTAAYCPNGTNGVVMEYCDETGSWVEDTSNCVAGICEEPNDTLGNAYWPTTEGGDTASPTSCIEGYEEQVTPPTRVCNADGSWGTVSFQCVRKTCTGNPANSYATFPSTFVGETDILGTCDVNYAAPDGFPLADCGLDQDWTNLRVPCTLVCPEYTEEDDVDFSGVYLWYDAADECQVFSDNSCSTNATAGSDNVGCILDKSGNGFNATQATSTLKPAYTSGAAGQNGLPTMEFDGTGKRLTFGNTASMATTSVFAVHNRTSTKLGHVIIGEFADTSPGGASLYFSDSNAHTMRYWVYGQADEGITMNKTYPSTTEFMITGLIDDGKDATFYYNGHPHDGENIDSSVSKDWGPGIIGAWGSSSGDYRYQGKIGEIMLYDTDLSASQRETVETYLGDKWNINNTTLFENAVLWLDANDGSTLFQNSGCSTSASTGQDVGCWQDKSGRNNHAIQATSTREPRYQANAMNSKPVVLFDRSNNEHLYIPNSSGNDFDFRDGFTIITVLHFDEIGDYWGTFFTRNGGDEAYPFDIGAYKEKSSSSWRFYFDVGDGGGKGSDMAYNESSNGSITTDTDYITTFRSTEEDYHTIYINGSLNSSNSDGSTVSDGGDDVLIGSWDGSGGEGHEGEIAEIIVYGSSISVSDKESIELYLGDKWGIATPDLDPLSCSSASTLPVTSNNILWLDANDCSTVYQNTACSTLADSSGDSVGCWEDKSGRNNDAIQSNSSKKPTYVGGLMNSLPVINNERSTNQHLYVPNSAGNDFDMTGNWTIFMTIKYDEIGDYWGTILYRGDTSSDSAEPFDIGSYKEKSSGSWRFYYDIGNGSSVTFTESTNGSITTNTDYVVTFRTNSAGNNHSVYINGSLDTTDTSSATINGTNDTVYIGSFDGTGGAGHHGEIAEIIIYDSALSNTAGGAREQVEDYLGSKWGITISH